VITDGVFSMEGAVAKLPQLVEICKRHDAMLVVDDSPALVTLLGGVLRGAGYQVRAATDGARALALAAAQAPELVLLDLRMPGLDGYEVCRRLKNDPTTASVPVIVISALEEVDEKLKAFEAGAADYVLKPFEPREVLARVGAHVQLYRLQRELERSRRELAEQNEELVRKNDELERAERRTRHVFSALASALPGTVLDGKYRLEQKIGAGGFATVFRAVHLQDLDIDEVDVQAGLINSIGFDGQCCSLILTRCDVPGANSY